MKTGQSIFVKVLSPKLASKALQAFDRSTAIVVSVCWAAALVTLSLAIYTVIAAAGARRAGEAALAAEPVLPKIVRGNVDVRTTQTLVDRLHKRYPSITFRVNNDQTLHVTASDGYKFREWLMALSYIDIISPEYHWSIQDLCVGHCRGEVMNASLRAERISFSAPEIKDANK